MAFSFPKLLKIFPKRFEREPTRGSLIDQVIFQNNLTFLFVSLFSLIPQDYEKTTLHTTIVPVALFGQENYSLSFDGADDNVLVITLPPLNLWKI